MVAGKFERTFIGTQDADLGQSIGHFHGALAATTPGLPEPQFELGVVGIKTQADDMDGLMQETD